MNATPRVCTVPDPSGTGAELFLYLDQSIVPPTFSAS